MKKEEKKVIEELKALQKSGDIETAHIAADAAICDFLKFLGYKEVAEAYDAVPKWFA